MNGAYRRYSYKKHLILPARRGIYSRTSKHESTFAVLFPEFHALIPVLGGVQLDLRMHPRSAAEINLKKGDYGQP